MKIAATLNVLIFGFVLGWIASTHWSAGAREAILAQAASAPNNKQSADGSFSESETTQNNTDASLPEKKSSEVLASKATMAQQDSPKTLQQRFFSLLDAGRYSDAMDVYQHVQAISAKASTVLRHELLVYMSALMSSDNSEDFIALTDAYLSLKYDDVDVLLLLAEFNTQADYFLDAINIYQLANEYAYSQHAKQNVNGKFSEFLTRADESLSVKYEWYLLSQLYSQAESVDLLSASQRLRMAEVYIENDERYSAQQTLLQLIGSGESVTKANKLLASITEQADVSPAGATEAYDGAVALEKHGNHYLVRLTLDDQASVRLLIDTGASVTTLSRSAYRRVASQIQVEELGSRMFRTANGVTKGAIVGLDNVSLGEFRLSDTQLAVLDFEMADNIDGLLGMNMLGHFKFQIEPMAPQLFLQRR
ncbi:MAG: aspartyl protease family protein [Agarilytica sp.]